MRRSLHVVWDLADVERSRERTVRTLNLRVSRRIEASDGVMSLELTHPDGDELPQWAPGAHVAVTVPNPGGEPFVRQYSLFSDPQDLSSYRIGILRELAGRGGSASAHDNVVEGSTVRVSWPRNNFRLKPARHYQFIAGGIGITPVLAMVRDAERVGASWELVYGGRSRGSMAFLDELAQYGDRVTLVPQDEFGHIDLPGILQEVREDTLIYACGPEPLLRAAESNTAHWPKDSLRLERFAPKAIENSSPNTSFDVEFAESEKTVTVGTDESILEAAEKAGLPVISSCQEGTCGTCETPVLQGKVDHRDSILSPSEQEASETMMICVSRANGTCPLLVLNA